MGENPKDGNPRSTARTGGRENDVALSGWDLTWFYIAFALPLFLLFMNDLAMPHPGWPVWKLLFRDGSIYAFGVSLLALSLAELVRSIVKREVVNISRWKETFISAGALLAVLLYFYLRTLGSSQAPHAVKWWKVVIGYLGLAMGYVVHFNSTGTLPPLDEE